MDIDTEVLVIVLLVVALAIGLGVGYIIGVVSNDDKCQCTAEVVYVNQTDGCIQEVFDTIEDGEEMKRKIYEYINYG